jgi:hypothetical protein
MGYMFLTIFLATQRLAIHATRVTIMKKDIDTLRDILRTFPSRATEFLTASTARMYFIYLSTSFVLTII